MVKYQNGNAYYEMNVDSVKKVFHLRATGFFAEEDGVSYLNDYDKTVKTFPTKDYALIIDGSQLKPSSPQVAEALGTLLEKYMKIPFKKRFLVTEGNAIAIAQFKRLGGQIPGWNESVQYVNTVNDAMKNI